LKRFLAAAAFLLWIGVLISAYYVFQRPGLLQAFTGMAGTVWTLLVTMVLLFNGYSVGTRILRWAGLISLESIDLLLLGCGTGLGALGLLGLLFSAAQLARAPILFFFVMSSTVFFILRRDLERLQGNLRDLLATWNLSFSQFNLFSKVVIVLPFLFSFLLTVVPPFEAFDALLYHLAQPAQILQDGGLRAIDITPFWFPSLTEETYLWALALGSERAAQMIHLAWGALSVLLLWRWAFKVWGIEIARRTLLLLAGLPSLPMLASWAYADMALVFYATALLYALTLYRSTKLQPWLWTAAVLAGLAMGVKYTSFTVPLTGGLLILFWGRREFQRAIRHAAQFSTLAMVTAAPWYIRNAVIMENPIYPFMFGGRYWDSFLSAWYANSGTGIGWNPLQIGLLPLNVVLGHHDVTFYDGRIGPLFLLLAPLAGWVLISRSSQDTDRRISLEVIGLFAALSFTAWAFGVINSAALWQARLLLPALIPFAIPTALGWDSLTMLDTPRLRVSFLANTVIAIVIILTIFDNAIFVLQRNPVAVALGAQGREGYIARVNPSYAALMQRMNELPETAYVYALFEPRSYGLPRRTQPDAINYNFARDFNLYREPSEIIQQWKRKGYTHVLLYERGLTLAVNDPSGKFTSAMQEALKQTLATLEYIDQTPDTAYTMYRIP
jgi:4-amino-4-deoxy-L-arabinose transferase-like glycosyltransferase